jgi:hypothetical protein
MADRRAAGALGKWLKSALYALPGFLLWGFFGFGDLGLRHLCVFAICGRSAGAPGFSPGFPVEFGGFGELQARFFMERRTRGSLQGIVAGNPGPGNG